MFASEFTGPGDPMYERLGELTLAVICSSLAYYFSVVWVEVIAVMYPSLKFSFVSGAVDQKKDQQILDEAGNVIGTKGDEAEEEEAMFALQTEGMNEDERDSHRLRLAEVGVVYADTNPILVRQFGSAAAAQAALAASASVEASGKEPDRGPALLTLAEQVALQGTVAKLMDEIKGLKKKVALGGAASAGAAHGGGYGDGGANGSGVAKKKVKTKVGGGVRPGDERKMRAGPADDSGGEESRGQSPPKPAVLARRADLQRSAAFAAKSKAAARAAPKKKAAGGSDEEVEVDLGHTFGQGGLEKAAQVVRLGGRGDAQGHSGFVANPMSRGAALGGGNRPGGGILNPMAAQTSSGDTKKKTGTKKAGKMAGAVFDNEDLL